MIATELVQVKFSKIMQTRSYTVVVIGTDEKKFALYTEPSVGKTLQLYLAEGHHPRPLTSDLIGTLFDGFDITLRQVVINELKDTVYYARLFLEQECDGIRRIVEIDARPSDCLALALLKNAPIYCTKEVLDRSVPV